MHETTLPFKVAGLPRRRAVLGYLISLSGFVLLIAFFIGGVTLVENEIVPPGIGFISFIIALLFGTASALSLFEFGKKLRQMDALTAITKDELPPVLFLRSFQDEYVVDLTSRTGRGGVQRSEENLCKALHRLGPVIAIGQPGETLPEIGAARIYVDDVNWQAAIRFFMRRASAIVIVVGHSPGIWWEIEAAFEEVNLTRLLFFFPYTEKIKPRHSLWHRLKLRHIFLSKKIFEQMMFEREKRYSVFLEKIGLHMNKPLPKKLGSVQFIDFLEDGTPRLLETVRPAFLDSFFQASLTNLKVGIHLEHTLNPFLCKLGKCNFNRSKSMW